MANKEYDIKLMADAQLVDELVAYAVIVGRMPHGTTIDPMTARTNERKAEVLRRLEQRCQMQAEAQPFIIRLQHDLQEIVRIYEMHNKQHAEDIERECRTPGV